MATLQVQEIRLAFGDRDILDGIALTLSSQSRAALVGANGSGKSTLMKILAQVMSADVYEVNASRNLRISYLPQSDIVFGAATLYEETERAFDRFSPLVAEQRTLEEALTQETNQGYLLRLNEIHETLLEERYHDRKQIIESVLFGLGFSNEDLTRTCDTFSGGWQMRIALAKILIEAPEIMLLDEPTNYLDIEARRWLLSYLKAYTGGIMLVSHDQGFLDAMVDEVYELFHGKIRSYRGNYSTYVIHRKAELAALEAEAKAQERLFAQNQVFIDRFRSTASRSRQVQSRIKMLDKIERVEIPPHLRELSFRFADAPPSGNDVLIIEELYKAYGELVVYEDFSFWVNRGDRIAVTGKNGSGKSTLLRLIAGIDTQYSGTLRLGTKVKTGYFSQETGSMLNPRNTLLEEASEAASTADQVRLRTLLGTFLFEGDDVFKRVGVLSGGEKSRLALLKILLQPANLLILDEPTNHLDITSKRMLLDALLAFQGTILFVSHDAYFIEELATSILYLDDDAPPRYYQGTYNNFLSTLEAEEARISTSSAPAADQTESEGRIAYREANRIKNRIATLQKEEEDLSSHCAALEVELASLDTQMAAQENYTDGERMRALLAEKEEIADRLSASEQQYFRLLEERERLQEGVGSA